LLSNQTPRKPETREGDAGGTKIRPFRSTSRKYTLQAYMIILDTKSQAWRVQGTLSIQGLIKRYIYLQSQSVYIKTLVSAASHIYALNLPLYLYENTDPAPLYFMR